MNKKKIIGFVTGMCAYAGMIFLFSGYMHLKSHPFINGMMVDAFISKAATNSFGMDADKFKNYEFALNNDKVSKPVGPALITGEYYISYSAADEYNAGFTPREWMKAGGWMEDEPWGPASLCHFYDPVAIDGGFANLTDRATNAEFILTAVIIYYSYDARTWTSLSSNKYNWRQAKESVVKALQQTVPSERNKYMAIAYRSLGETLHLIADMGCPPHVRNDSHPPAAFIPGNNMSYGNPDPYEDLSGTIDLTQFTGPAYPPNEGLEAVFCNTNKFEYIFDAMAAFTNERVPTNQTIKTGRYKQLIRSGNPYTMPSITEADYRSARWAYVKTYDGKEILMCKDKHPYTFLSGDYRGQPYIDKECVESQASMLVPNIVEAGANVIRLFVPALKIELTAAKADSNGVIRGIITYTVPSSDDEYSGLFDLKNIYTGPVSLFVNGTKLNAQCDAKNGSFELKNIAPSVTLKKDDLVKAQIEFGGILLNSDGKKVEDIQVTPVTVAIDPSPVLGKPNDKITITAKTNGSAPKNAKFVWSFGDGSSDETKTGDSVVVHTFTREGRFDIQVKVYDSANKLIATTFSQAVITAVIVPNFKRISFRIHVGASYTTSVSGKYEIKNAFGSILYQGDTSYTKTGKTSYDFGTSIGAYPQKMDIAMAGNTFSGRSIDNFGVTKTISGSYDPIAKTLSASYSVTSLQSDPYKSTKFSASFSANGVPESKGTPYYFAVEGAPTCNFLPNLSYSHIVTPTPPYGATLPGLRTENTYHSFFSDGTIVSGTVWYFFNIGLYQ